MSPPPAGYLCLAGCCSIIDRDANWILVQCQMLGTKDLAHGANY